MLDPARLAGRMEQLGVSQAELARRVGLSQQAIGKLVHGKSRETPKLHQIARALGTTPDYLLGNVADPEAIKAGTGAVASDELEWGALYAALTAAQRGALRMIARDLARSNESSARQTPEVSL